MRHRSEQERVRWMKRRGMDPHARCIGGDDGRCDGPGLLEEVLVDTVNACVWRVQTGLRRQVGTFLVGGRCRYVRGAPWETHCREDLYWDGIPGLDDQEDAPRPVRLSADDEWSDIDEWWGRRLGGEHV